MHSWRVVEGTTTKLSGEGTQSQTLKVKRYNPIFQLIQNTHDWDILNQKKKARIIPMLITHSDTNCGIICTIIII